MRIGSQSLNNDTVVGAALIRTLYKQKPSGVLAHIVVSSVFAGLLWDKLDHGVLFPWLAALYLFTVARTVSIIAFRRSKSVDTQPQRWAAMSTVFCGISGVLWGIIPWLFLVPGDLEITAIITVILMGLGAGAAISLAGHLPACFAFVLATQLGLISALLMNPEPISLAISMLAGYALAANLSNSVSMHRELKHNVRLSQDNLALRREAEGKNQQLETTLNNMGQGIALLDTDRRLEMSNARLFELLEIEPDQTHLQLATGCEGASPCELILPSGRVVALAEQPLNSGEQVLTVTDITQLKAREQELQHALDGAEQANAAKTRFLAAASHDLRQPIHALGLYFEALSSRVEAEPLRPLIGKIDDAINAIDSMLNALLDISKLDAGVITPNIASVNLASLLERLKNELQPLAETAGNRLKMRVRAVSVYSDEVMLERVLRNLISNALRYTEHGRVLVGVRVRGDWVRVEVHDTGIGIPDSQQQEIFLEFHQLGNPERDRRQGLGLGLAIVKRISGLLNHQISVRSTAGRGSVFTLKMRLSSMVREASIVHMEKLRSVIDDDFAGRSILVLDDDPSILEAMKAMFGEWGLKVIAVDSIDAGVAALREQEQPEALIVDYRLRGGDTGLDAIEILRGQLGRTVPAALVTGDTGPERLRQARASGHPLLHKPVRPVALRNVLRQLFKRAA